MPTRFRRRHSAQRSRPLFNAPWSSASTYAAFTEVVSFGTPNDVVEPISVTFEISLDGSCSGTDGAIYGFARSGCNANIYLGGPPWLGLGLGQPGTTSFTTQLVSDQTVGLVGQLGISGFGTDGEFSGDLANTGHVYIFRASLSRA